MQTGGKNRPQDMIFMKPECPEVEIMLIAGRGC